MLTVREKEKIISDFKTHDGDTGSPGIQYSDADAVTGAPLLFYRATAVNDCGNTPL